jgi:hypothetical protein
MQRSVARERVGRQMVFELDVAGRAGTIVDADFRAVYCAA